VLSAVLGVFFSSAFTHLFISTTREFICFGFGESWLCSSAFGWSWKNALPNLLKGAKLVAAKMAILQKAQTVPTRTLLQNR